MPFITPSVFVCVCYRTVASATPGICLCSVCSAAWASSSVSPPPWLWSGPVTKWPKSSTTACSTRSSWPPWGATLSAFVCLSVCTCVCVCALWCVKTGRDRERCVFADDIRENTVKRFFASLLWAPSAFLMQNPGDITCLKTHWKALYIHIKKLH